MDCTSGVAMAGALGQALQGMPRVLTLPGPSGMGLGLQGAQGLGLRGAFPRGSFPCVLHPAALTLRGPMSTLSTMHIPTPSMSTNSLALEAPYQLLARAVESSHRTNAAPSSGQKGCGSTSAPSR